MRVAPAFAAVCLIGAALGPALGQERERGTPEAATGPKSNQQQGESALGKEGGPASDDTGRRARAAADGGTGQLSISPEQQQKVREALAKANPNRLDSVNSTVTVGAAVPRQVELRDLPNELSDIMGGYKGAQYVLVRDQLVIVDKEARRIVAIIPGMG